MTRSTRPESSETSFAANEPEKRSLVDELLAERKAEALRELTDEEVLAMWRRGELVVRTGRIHHGNLCVCPEKGDGEWCDKCEGYALEQGQ